MGREWGQWIDALYGVIRGDKHLIDYYVIIRAKASGTKANKLQCVSPSPNFLAVI